MSTDNTEEKVEAVTDAFFTEVLVPTPTEAPAPKVPTFESVVEEAKEKYGVVVGIEPHRVTFDTKEKGIYLYLMLHDDGSWSVCVKCKASELTSPITLPIFSNLSKVMAADFCLSLAVGEKRYIKQDIQMQPFPYGSIGREYGRLLSVWDSELYCEKELACNWRY